MHPAVAKELHYFATLLTSAAQALEQDPPDYRRAYGEIQILLTAGPHLRFLVDEFRERALRY